MTRSIVEDTVESLRSFGNRPAVESDGAAVTYRQLADDVDRLARWLCPQPALAGRRPALITSSHTPRTVAAILACVRACVTYVPVPADTPESRLTHIREAVDAGVHLRDTNGDITVQSLDTVGRDSDERDDIALAVLHTSGSTGAPKSVVIEHRNLDHFLRWCRHALPLTDTDRLALLSPLHFDLCTHDIYHGLASGATLIMPDEFERTNAQAAARFIVERGATVLYMVPTFLERVATAVTRSVGRAVDVRTVMFAGERLSARGRTAVEAAFPNARLHNLYGPIETNVITARELLRGRANDSSDVGQALPGVGLRIRTADGSITEAGRGELVVSGTAVTPGYLDSHHNIGKFVTAPTGDRFYRTGDEATLSAAGVHLHGRLDNMVKLRGQRIELDEVEAVIAELEHVAQSAVIVGASADALEAYVVLSDADHERPTSEEPVIGGPITAHCRARLPEVAVPAHVFVIDGMPITATGKIDRRSLREHRLRTALPVPSGVNNSSEPTDPVHAIEEFLADHLGNTPAQLRALPVLREHPAFNSVVAAQCIEAVEDRLGCSADYDRLTGHSFDTITSMGELFDHHS
ncbi:AMP-binding protein [Nocardia callitridis]|uniref:Uncharacterized protein n=1 Tax=Nocardia callitridis TaxID=648753 RepID=A0ABP9KAR5_9NOCA